MSDIYASQRITEEVEALLTLRQSELEELLEMRVAAINQSTSLVIEPTFEVTGLNYESLPSWVTKTVTVMKNTALEQTYKLFCSEETEFRETRDKLINALNLGGTTLVLAVAAALTTTLGLAAALATVLATIVIKTIGEPTLKAGVNALCEEFNNILPK